MATQGGGHVLARRYRIERRLGAGSSASVFVALDTQSNVRVAVKVLHHLYQRDRTARKRFLREARAARSLDTPHAVKIFDVGELAQGVPYLVMELLEGSTLERIVHQDGPLPVERALYLADQMASALQEAHGLDIIHRDMKPENVFVVDTPGGELAKVMDFGVSKLGGGGDISQLTGTGVLIGTPVYMAPEQIEGARDIDQRIDVYALGVVIYEMLAGRSPFAGAGDFSTLLRMLIEPAPLLTTHRKDLPPGLAEVVAHAMAPDRKDRTPNMEMLRAELTAFWSGRRPSLPTLQTAQRGWFDSAGDADEEPVHRDPSGPDFEDLFVDEEQGSATRARTLDPPRPPLPSSPPGPASHGGGGVRRGPGFGPLPPPVPPPRRDPNRVPPGIARPAFRSPSAIAPPPPRVAYRASSASTPSARSDSPRPPDSAPPPRAPAPSTSHIVRPPMQSGVISTPVEVAAAPPAPRSKPSDDDERDNTNLEWPPPDKR